MVRTRCLHRVINQQQKLELVSVYVEAFPAAKSPRPSASAQGELHGRTRVDETAAGRKAKGKLYARARADDTAVATKAARIGDEAAFVRGVGPRGGWGGCSGDGRIARVATCGRRGGRRASARRGGGSRAQPLEIRARRGCSASKAVDWRGDDCEPLAPPAISAGAAPDRAAGAAAQHLVQLIEVLKRGGHSW